MNAEYAVLKMLLGNTVVTDIVGQRVHLDEAPQGERYPLIIIEEENVEPFDSKDGVSVTDHDTIRVFPYAETKATLRLLAKACRDAIDGATGTFNGYQVVDAKFRNQSSFDELFDNRKVHAKDQEYLVRIKL